MNTFKLIIISLLIISYHNGYCQTPVIHSGFPLVLDSLNTPISITPPLLADLNRDGSKVIITSTWLQGYKSILYVIKNDGSNQQGFPKQYNNTTIDQICAGDVDKDGYIDIVFRDQNFIHVLNKFGNEVQGFPVSFETQRNGKFISLYDLDGDGALEIIAGRESQLAVFSSNGQLKSGWPRAITSYSSAIGSAVGDLDGDGYAEIVLPLLTVNPLDSTRISIFRYDGSNFSNNWPVIQDSGYATFLGTVSLYVNRINPDSTFIFVPSTKNISGISNLNRITKYDIYGRNKGEVTLNSYSDFGTPVLGDINRDGKLEIADGTSFSYFTYVFTDEIKPVPGWPQEGNGSDISQILIGKLKTGNSLNVISNNTYEWFGYGSAFLYNLNASQFSFSPLHPYGLSVGTTMADIDYDGSVELIVSGFIQKRSFIEVFSFPGIAYNINDFPWPTFAHDRYRTNQFGFVPPDETIGIIPVSQNIPAIFKLKQNYPNPFNPFTNIEFDISRRSLVSIIIYDILGRVVSKPVNQVIETGTFKTLFDGSNLASGIYFAKLESYSTEQSSGLLYSSVIKMSLVK